jgi:hypothetical protein
MLSSDTMAKEAFAPTSEGALGLTREGGLWAGEAFLAGEEQFFVVLEVERAGVGDRGHFER